jgi:hypothetical protein
MLHPLGFSIWRGTLLNGAGTYMNMKMDIKTSLTWTLPVAQGVNEFVEAVIFYVLKGVLEYMIVAIQDPGLASVLPGLLESPTGSNPLALRRRL